MDARAWQTRGAKTPAFSDPYRTADGALRAHVTFRGLKTLWFNTGTLCNLTCRNCYIGSSPVNDSLTWLNLAEVTGYLDQTPGLSGGPLEIGFTGGEPFMNPDIIAMIDTALDRAHRVLVLTNAMRPMEKWADALLAIQRKYGPGRLAIRVSVDHYRAALHESERGANTWQPMLKGLKWLSENGFKIAVAGRTFCGENDASLRQGFGKLFAAEGIAIEAFDPAALILFPEMDSTRSVPEITTDCWRILNVDPADMMCAASRMIVKRRGAARPVVLPCTLLTDDTRFDMGPHLAGATGMVSLNHPHCARFCVLGGGSCSAPGNAG